MSIITDEFVKNIRENSGKYIWITVVGQRAFKTNNAHFVDAESTTLKFIDVVGNELTCHISQVVGVMIAKKRDEENGKTI